MKLTWRLILGFFVSVLALAACLPSFLLPDDEDLAKTATVAAIPGLQRGGVVISDLQHGTRRISWKALTPQGEFTCEASLHLELPACVHK